MCIRDRSNISFAAELWAVRICATLILPSVSVPVLSNTKCVTLDKVSSTKPFLTNMPCLAPKPVATATDIGVAIPSAQGQVMISTEVAAIRASSKFSVFQMKNVSVAQISVTKTNHGTMESAMRCIGALEACASSTSRMIFASVVFCNVEVTSTSSAPLVFTVPAETFAPTALLTGADSPLNMDSSTALCPSSTMPSTGTL